MTPQEALYYKIYAAKAMMHYDCYHAYMDYLEMADEKLNPQERGTVQNSIKRHRLTTLKFIQLCNDIYKKE